MMASATTNLLEAELVIQMTLGGGSDNAGRSAQILSETFPVTGFALDIRIQPVR